MAKDTPKKWKPDCEALPLGLECPAVRLLWKEFCQGRRERRRPITPIACKRLMNQLAGLTTAEAAEMLDLAIEKEWRRFKWEWVLEERVKNSGGGRREKSADDQWAGE